MAKNRLEDWINIPAIMETKHGIVRGSIKYGVRLPIMPATIPLQECEPNSREKIKGVKPRCWFVNSELALKIRLITKKVYDDSIKGFAYSSEFFWYTIKRR